MREKEIFNFTDWLERFMKDIQNKSEIKGSFGKITEQYKKLLLKLRFLLNP